MIPPAARDFALKRETQSHRMQTLVCMLGCSKGMDCPHNSESVFKNILDLDLHDKGRS